MRIITFAASLADDAPERLRCCARILLADGSLHPVVVHAPTKPEAREKAQAFWDAELARERKRQDARQQRAATMRQAREAKSQPAATEQAA